MIFLLFKNVSEDFSLFLVWASLMNQLCLLEYMKRAIESSLDPQKDFVKAWDIACDYRLVLAQLKKERKKCLI